MPNFNLDVTEEKQIFSQRLATIAKGQKGQKEMLKQFVDGDGVSDYDRTVGTLVEFIKDKQPELNSIVTNSPNIDGEKAEAARICLTKLSERAKNRFGKVVGDEDSRMIKGRLTEDQVRNLLPVITAAMNQVFSDISREAIDAAVYEVPADLGVPVEGSRKLDALRDKTPQS